MRSRIFEFLKFGVVFGMFGLMFSWTTHTVLTMPIDDIESMIVSTRHAMIISGVVLALALTGLMVWALTYKEKQIGELEKEGLEKEKLE